MSFIAKKVILPFFLISIFSASTYANPTGGQVAAGSASINTVPGTVTINQASNTAVINWQTFSIGSGELTKFIQPSSSSATLNRVLGGQMSVIDGTLSANGQVYLLNGNGILVGPGGVVNTNAFIASTRNLSDADFASGNLHFTGTGDAGVTNLGKVNALGGDVIFIGKTVDNEGEINAPNGHVGLAAADDVMVTQSGMEHVFVRSTTNPSSASGKTGVNNSGKITAAAAELKAANGNVYALAVNNSGLIRATGVANEGGHIWLVAEGNQGVTKNTGTLTARKANGQGGAIETSGSQVIANGTVDAGNGGTWLIDPSDIIIDAPTAATIVTSLNGGTTVTEDSSLGSGGNGDITVSSTIDWTGTGTLNLYAYRNLNINSDITGNNGSLNIKSGTGGTGTVSAPANISVGNFALQGGSWIQNADTLPGNVLPTFSANNFTISAGSFLRVAGGSGVASDPYQVADVYGLQGIGSSAAYEAASWRDSVAINASGTSGWNSGAGFAPIGNFTGTFDGNGNVGAISNLFINRASQTNAGLFSQVGASGVVANVVMTGVNITGLSNVGSIVGNNAGLVTTSSAAGTVKGTNGATSLNIGGLVGLNSGSVVNSSASTSVTGYGNTGGLVGNSSGALTSDFATGTVSSFLKASLSGSNIGGLLGFNNGGTLTLDFATGNVNATDSFDIGGLVGDSKGSSALIQQSYTKGSTIGGYSFVGGLVGDNETGATITGGKLIDGPGNASVTGTLNVGGLAGANAGTVSNSSVLSTGSILGKDRAGAASWIGGFIGNNSGVVTGNFASITVGQAVGTVDAQYVGGFLGLNTSTGNISSSYSTGNATGFLNVGGFAGENDGILGIQSNASGTVNGTTNVGGLIGNNTGTLSAQSFATGQVTGVTSVGGLIGNNNTSVAIANVYARGNVSGTTDVGGLVGSNLQGNFTTSNATGTVTGGALDIGGLMGSNAGTITLSFASGNVTAASATNVGGLVGNNTGSIGQQSSASGTVVGNIAVGGLVGANSSSGIVGDAVTTVEDLNGYTHATGAVTGHSLVGGLIGDNFGLARQTSANNAVKGSSNSSFSIGGLVGGNESTGTITVSFSGSTVYGNGTAATNGAATDTQIGGLAGINLGAISKSFATGSVVGDNATGGLVGLEDASGAIIQISYSTGNVTGLTSTGGLVGYNELGTVEQNYSTSAVIGTTDVGGLVGLNGDKISENYATGAVTGSVNVGGFLGRNASGASLTQSYATGAVTSTGLSGGLVGLNSGSVANSYWDQDSTTKGTTGIGNDVANTGATGLTSAGATPTAFSSGSYAGFGTSATVAGGASNAVQITDGASQVAWYMLDGSTRPFLAWEAPINGPVKGGSYLIYTAHELQLMAVSLNSSYVLGKDINLSETQQVSNLWNTATGFAPVGTFSKPFTGSLGGGGFGISNLSINAPTLSDVGLFGASSGTLSGISLSGNVTGLNDVGLLTGLNEGQITDVTLTGTVTGQTNVGGLAGENLSTVQSFAVDVTANGNSNVGGVIGNNSGTAKDGYSIGNVNGTGASQSDLGGLVGLNSGTLTIAYETGAVTGDSSTSTNVGGDVGRNTTSSGKIGQIYATGTVTGGTNIGGVAGAVDTNATILQSYATGTIHGLNEVGGIAGLLTGGGQVNSSYASGTVTGTTNVGGLLGQVDVSGSYANLFWDSTKAAQAVGSDGNPGTITDLHGKTINANTVTYAGFDTSGIPGFAPGVGSSSLVYGSGDAAWRIQSGSEFPFLTQLSTQISGTSYSNATHTTLATGATVTLNSGNNLLNTTTTDGTTAAYDFLFAADDGLFNYLPNTGSTLRISDGAHDADSIAAKNFSANGVPNLLADVAPADTWGDTVRVVSNGLNNDLLAQAGSAFITVPTVNAFGGTNLGISENFEVASSPIISSYSIDGDITAHGNVTFDSSGNVPSSYEQTVTLNAAATGGNPTPAFTLNAPLSSNAANRAIVVESDGNFVNNVGTGAFSTPNGSWIVYSQNPEDSGQPLTDQTDGLNELHLYGTNYTQTPAYLLSPGLNYQIYSFTPTLTLTAVATGANPAGTLTVEYGTPTPSLMYTVSGLLPGDSVTSGVTFNQVLSNQPGEQTTYAKYSNVGDYPVTFIGSTLPTSLIGYKLVFASGDINVTPNSSPVTIDVSGSQYFAYIGGGPTFNFTASGSVAGDPNFNPTFNTSLGQFANVNHDGSGNVIPYAGTITLNAASLSNYSNVTITTVDNGYTVKPAALTVTANGTSIYGDSIATPTINSNSPTGSFTVYDNSGTGNTTAISGLGYTFTNPAVTSASHVGNYAFNVQGQSGNASSGVLGNYDVTINPGTYAITQRPLVINATQDETHVYDGTPGQTTFDNTDYTIGATAPGTGLVNGDVVTGLMGRVSDTNPNVGHYNYTQGTLATADSGNNPTSDYAITYNNNGFGLDITPVSITISALKGTTKVYGSADPAFDVADGYYTISSGALVSGESFTPGGVLGRVAGEAVNGETVYQFNSIGTIGIANSGNGNSTGNYAITFANPNGYGLTITPAPLTVTAKNDTLTYNATAFSGGNGVTYSGFQFSDNASSLGGTLAYSGTSQGAINAGSYIITPGGYTSGNYTISYVNGTLTINPALLTVKAKNDTITYNATAFSGGNGVTYTGFQGTDNASVLGGALAYSGTSQGAINAGSYVITPNGYTSNNYTFSYKNGTLTINKAPLTVTADNQSKVYGAADPTLTYTPSGTLYGSDTYSVISGVGLSTATGAAATAGTHTITATGGTATNYVITDVNGTLTVSKASAIGIIADDKSKVYGATDPTLTYSLASGTLYYGDTITSAVTGVSLSTTTGALATAGTHTITASGGVSANYNLSPDQNGTLTVSQAPLTITANDKSKVYGATDPTLTYSVGGTLYYGDTTSVVSGVSLSTVTGAAATAGTHTITATGGTASNYIITQDNNGTLTVSKAPLTVTADGQSKTYGDVDPTLTYTPTGTLYYGDDYSVISGVTLNTVTGAAATAGTHTITTTGGTASNYVITDVNGTLTVAKATLTATADDKSKVYGAADPTLTYTPSGTLFYSDTYGVISGVGLSTTTGALATAGTHTITATGGTASNYNIVDVNGTLTVSQASLTVTANDKSKVYGATDPTLTYSVGGTLYYGDTASVVSGVNLSTTTGAAATVGTHTITATGGTASNYIITQDNNGTLTVSQAPLTVTADDQSKTYGGVDPTLTYTPSGTLYYGDSYSVISGVGLSTTTGAAATAGTHTITATGGTASNYVITDVNGTLTVGKATLTATADDQSKVYGAADPTLTYTPSGTLFYSDTYGVISGVGLSTTTGALATAGTHTITATGGTASNYNIVDVNGTLTVSQASLTVTADNQSKTYGGTDPTLTYTPSGTLYYGDSYGVISGVGLSTTTGALATAGTHTITAAGGTASNYVITDVNGTLTVDKATLTATADDKSKTYGDADPTLTYTASGTLFYGDTYGVISGVNLDTTTGAAATAGTHTITATGGTASNYNIVDVNGTLTVDKATLTATADDKSKTYGDVDPTLTYTASGTLFYGDTYGVISGVNLSTTTGAAATAGTHTITATGGAASNYNIVDVNGTLTVNQAPLTVTADNQSKTYGDADPTLTYTPSGTLFYGDTYGVISGVALDTTTGAAATAGTHTITVTGGTASNYAITDVNGTLTVGKATLTAIADDKSKTYGDADPTLTYTASGTLFYGDTYGVISGVNLNTTTGAAATAGIHTITTTGGTASNYNIVDVDGTLTVGKATLTATADDKSKTYGDADPTLTYTASGTLFYGDTYGVISGVALDTTTGAAATAGTHTITTTGGTASNYNIVDANGTLTVGKATLTATADDKSKTYGDADPTLTYTASGTLFYGDTYGVISGVNLDTTTGAAATAGTHTITATGGTADNYNIVDANGTLTVGKATLTATADDKSKTYGDPDPTLTYTVGGTLFYGDTGSVVTGVNLSTTTGAAATAGTHTITATGGTASNYNVVDGDGTLTVDKATLIITADPQTKLYGETFTFQGNEFHDSGLHYTDSLTQVTLTSPGTPALVPPGSYPIAMTPGSEIGSGLSNYTIVFNPSPFVVEPNIIGQPSVPGTPRDDFDQFVGIDYSDSYGEHRFYELEVPGTIHRIIPKNLAGIEIGSSLIDTRIGLETVYNVDRFQTFRH